MVILHIACISNDPFSGVSVVVPRHVAAQGKYAETALLNISGEKIDGVRQLTYASPFRLEDLPAPFDAPDLVVFHECYRFPYLSIAKSLKKKKIPYVIVPHGELTKEAQKKKHLKKAVANFLFFRHFADHALAIQCLSESERARTVLGKKKFVGTNGMTLPPKKKQNFRWDGLHFTYIGRMETAIKGIDLLIAALGKEQALLRDRRCVFSLYGPATEEESATIRTLLHSADVEDFVTVYPPVAGVEKERILLDSDIFIQTSRTEGMPLGILEAMAYGLPVLITEGTTLGGYVEKNRAGIAVTTDCGGIAKGICDAVLRADGLSAYSIHARECICRDFLWERVASDALAKYREFISNKNS